MVKVLRNAGLYAVFLQRGRIWGILKRVGAAVFMVLPGKVVVIHSEKLTGIKLF